MPPHISGETTEEKLDNLITYVDELYSIISRKFENIDITDLNASLASQIGGSSEAEETNGVNREYVVKVANDLEKKVDDSASSLGSRITSTNNDVTNLTNSLNATDRNVGTLQTNYSTLSTSLSGTQTTVNSLSTNVSSLSGNVSSLSSSVSTLSTSVGNLGTSLSNHTGNGDIHVSLNEKSRWNSTSVTSDEKQGWNDAKTLVNAMNTGLWSPEVANSIGDFGDRFQRFFNFLNRKGYLVK